MCPNLLHAHRPHRPHATPPPSALCLHCPFRPTAISALPTHSTSSPPSLTHRPHRPSSPPPHHLPTTLAALATARRLGPNGMNSKVLLDHRLLQRAGITTPRYRRRVRKCGSRSLPRLSSMVKSLARLAWALWLKSGLTQHHWIVTSQLSGSAALAAARK